MLSLVRTWILFWFLEKTPSKNLLKKFLGSKNRVGLGYTGIKFWVELVLDCLISAAVSSLIGFY